MTDEIKAHIAAVRATYHPLVVGAGSRIDGGTRLWRQFEDAVAAYQRHGRKQVSGLVERVNELAVAKQILADHSLSNANILYEPEIVRSGPKFDFLVSGGEGGELYIEVKTVAPRTEDNDCNWANVEVRQQHVTPGNLYIVDKEWMGAAIFGNSFSARSSFFDYTIETETKLRDHNAVRPGRAVLVFCGTGFAWKIDELEDFADFYRTGQHRLDDPFAKMEQHAIKQGAERLSRTLGGFAVMVRKYEDIDPAKWVYPVRGPSWE